MTVSRRIRKLILVTFGILYCAGVGYWLSRLFLRHQGEFGEEPHVLEKILGPFHLAAAFFFIFILGIVWERHIRTAIKAKQQRISGWVYVTLLALLASTGIVIVYGGEDITKIIEKVHPWLGASLLPVLIFHWTWKKIRR